MRWPRKERFKKKSGNENVFKNNVKRLGGYVLSEQKKKKRSGNV